MGASILFALTALIEIAIIYVAIYATLRFLQGTRGAGILRGLIFFIVFALLLMLFFVDLLGLFRLKAILTPTILAVFLFPLMILFQPEFRRVLIRLGENPLFRWLFKAESSVVEQVIRAVEELSRQKFGALIAIEGEVGLGAYVEGGVRLDAEVSRELLVNIFWPGAPLHDGAAVIRGSRIAAAECVSSRKIIQHIKVCAQWSVRIDAAIDV